MLHSVLNPRFEDVEALMQIMLLLTALVISVVVASITSIEASRTDRSRQGGCGIQHR